MHLVLALPVCSKACQLEGQVFVILGLQSPSARGRMIWWAHHFVQRESVILASDSVCPHSNQHRVPGSGWTAAFVAFTRPRQGQPPCPRMPSWRPTPDCLGLGSAARRLSEGKLSRTAPRRSSRWRRRCQQSVPSLHRLHQLKMTTRLVAASLGGVSTTSGLCMQRRSAPPPGTGTGSQHVQQLSLLLALLPRLQLPLAAALQLQELQP